MTEVVIDGCLRGGLSRISNNFPPDSFDRTLWAFRIGVGHVGGTCAAGSIRQYHKVLSDQHVYINVLALKFSRADAVLRVGVVESDHGIGFFGHYRFHC